MRTSYTENENRRDTIFTARTHNEKEVAKA
jgi:hypothetical protein